MSQIPITADDLDTFFEPGEFAQSIKVDGVDIDAIVTDFFDPMTIGEVGIEGAEVLVIAKGSDVAGVSHGVQVIVNETLEEFIVVQIRPDSSGLTRLQLARADA